MNMNRKLLCPIWIVSALLVGGLLWFFTQGFRMRLLAEEVNKVLAQNGGGRLGELLSSGFSGGGRLGDASLNGAWFEFRSPAGNAVDGSAGVSGSSAVDRAFVFTVLQNGLSAACVALVDSGGTVQKLIPLSGNASQLVETIPSSLYRFYCRRVEEAARNRKPKQGGTR